MFSKIGRNIYVSRKIKGWTQEQLAEAVDVSSVAVSKWERGINIPEVDVLCRLADLFEVSVDELLGRRDTQVDENQKYSREQLEDYDLGKKLIEYGNIAQKYGWLAVEATAQREKIDEFLLFAIHLLIDADKKGISRQQLSALLRNYSEKEKRKNRCEMICATLHAVTDGADEQVLKEIIASYLGREYRDKLVGAYSRDESREEVLQRFDEKECVIDLIEELVDVDDRTIQLILRQLDNETLISALYGASGNVCRKFLQNVSERLLYFLNVDIEQYAGDKEEVLLAQKRILGIAVSLQ